MSDENMTIKWIEYNKKEFIKLHNYTHGLG